MKYVGVSAPAWTILGKWKDHSPKPASATDEEAPPPPSILENKQMVKSQTRIPTKPRERLEKVYPPPKEAKLPPPVKNKRKKAMISKAERFPVSKDAAFGPGPTSYQQDIVTKSIASKMPNFSFGYKFDFELPKKESELIVLPPKEPIPFLHYPQFKHKEHLKPVTFSKAKKDSLAKLSESCAPGPGFYTIHEPKPYQKPPGKAGTFGIPKDPNSHSASTKEDDYVPNYPRYAEYVAPKYVPKSKALTRSLSEQQIKKPPPPQPSSANFFDEEFYKFKAKGPKWQFGKSERPPLNVTNQTDLGPGEYMGLGSQFKSSKNLNSLPRLPKAQRRPLNENKDIPGPGTYPLEIADDDVIGHKIKNKVHGPAFSMRGKYALPGSIDRDRMPGPGQYEVHNMNQIGMDKNKIGPTIYSSERNIAKKIEKDYDGPDMYNITKNLGSDEGIKFPKAKRKPIATNTDPDIDLGPGFYNLKPTVPQLQPYEQAKLDQLENFNLNLI